MKGYFDKQFHIQPHVVKLTNSTTVTTEYDAVVWPEPYVNVPAAFVVPVLGDAAVWTITPTTTGATLTVISGDITDQEYYLVIVSHEKL